MPACARSQIVPPGVVGAYHCFRARLARLLPSTIKTPE
jgi:hypothetical protein